MSMRESLKVIPFPDIEGAYIVISSSPDTDMCNGIDQTMSFFFDNGDGVGCEWEPKHGPLTRIVECSSGWKPAEDEYGEARPHFFYPFCTGYGNWSQMAVDECDLKHLLLKGMYQAVFGVLRNFTA